MSDETPGLVSFHRPARVHPEPVPEDPIVLAAPPPVPPAVRGTWLQILLPVVGSLGIVGFALVYRNTLFLAIAGGIAFLTVTLWIAIRIQQARGARRSRREAASRYRAYLADERMRIETVAAAQGRRLDRLHPDPDRLWTMVTSHRGLWERRREDDDFMHVRVGLGDLPLAAPIRLDLGSNPLTEFEPTLLAEGRELTLQLIPEDLHDAVRHTGGQAIIRENLERADQAGRR